MTERKGNIVDIFNKNIYYGIVKADNGKIKSIEKISDSPREGEVYISPGFIDSHVHIESSMLVPSEFARLAVVHGTVATVSDPHEIANVCGMEGVEFMISNGKEVPFKFNFGAPSCVPATVFETAGAALGPDEVDSLLSRTEILYLSEMMNFPGVLNNDEEVMKKIASAQKYNKPVDGHAPGLRGDSAKNYINAGISTDHECFTEEEAREKLSYGMKILIREGSAAKNFEALVGLLNEFPLMIMFCSDDKHPDSLELDHINALCRRSLKKGIDVFKVLQAACINPVLHYKMDVGLLRVNDPADFIILEDLQEFKVKETFINGVCVAENGVSKIKRVESKVINRFDCKKVDAGMFSVRTSADIAIGALDGQLITEKVPFEPLIKDGNVVADIANDILKIAVINRYYKAEPAIAFIKNFGLTKGAIASTVAHDSHNIVVIGADDASMAKAANLVVEKRGGISAVSESDEKVLALPVAGLMTTEDGYKTSALYTEIDNFVKQKLGSTLTSPFMTLSFMALLVIPHLKLSDKGLFDGDTFSFISV